MPQPILQVKQLNKTYSGIQVLYNIGFELLPGEVHALVGENGAGKSTLIKIMAGVEQPDPGSELYFNDIRVERMSPHKSMSMGLSVIYQDISLFPNLSIAENICKGLHKDFFVRGRKMYDTAQKALDMMGVSLDLEQNLEEVSVGKRQLVAIARAITFNAKAVVMDEPTAALSSSEVSMLYSIVRSLREKNIGVIYISHKLDEVFALADRITVFRDGFLVATGPAKEFDTEKLIRLMVGREMRFLPMHNEEGNGETLFELKGYTNAPYFRDISLRARKYEIVGLTGLVGAGRSELAQTLFGMMRPQSGEVYIHGEQVKIRSPKDAISKGICYLPEDRRTQGLFQGKTMAVNITAVTLEKMLNRFKLIREAKELDTSREYIEKLAIRPETPDINIENMSGGNQQKVLIARWLNADPRVLIVDEPTSGVDVGAKMEIHRLLRKLASQGVCIILISSDLSELLALSDRILIMRQGRIVDEVSTASATQEGIMEKGLLG